jgi:hypothetical protein
MIVNDLDTFRGTCPPDEADSPLIVDPVVQHPKLPSCHCSNVPKSATLLAVSTASR